MKADWKFFAKILGLPIFLFLCLDFLYRSTEMNVLRDAWLSFAFLQTAGSALAVAGAAALALLTSATGPSLREMIRRVAAITTTWCLLAFFLVYFKKWAFSFTFADELGTFRVLWWHLLLVTTAVVAGGLYLSRKGGPLPGLREAVSGASRRMTLLAVAVTVASLLSVIGSGLASLWAREANVYAAANSNGERQNVLVVVFDTLSAMQMDIYNPSAVPTPEFERWAHRGLLFKDARVNVTSTGPSISSLLTGKTPLRSHVLGYHCVDGNVSRENLFTYLESHGYGTESYAEVELASAAFHGFPTPTDGESLGYIPPRTDAFNRELANIARKLGFSLKFRVPPFFTRSLRPFAEVFGNLERSLREKAMSKRPFFSYVHIYLPARVDHEKGPAMTPSAYPRPYSPEEQPEIDEARRNYDRTVTDWDSRLGRFLDALEASGVLESTIVVVTADHGESFARGFWGHGNDLSEDSIRIPLLILTPDGKTGTISAPVQLADIAPTLLRFLEMPQPAWMDGIPAVGSSPRAEAVTFNYLIRTPLRTRVAFPGLQSGRSIALYRDGLKFIERPKGKTSEFYDLTKDPGESNNLAATEAARPLKERLEELISLPSS